MKTKKILPLLNKIERISKFQQKRIQRKDIVNKEITLRQSVEFIENYTMKIRELLK